MVDRRCPYQNDLSKDDLTKPYQNEWNRWEMNELRWIEWNEWIEGFDFVNLWSVEGVPIKVTWDEWFDQTLSKWSESMRNEWIEWIEVKWVNGRKWLGTTLWEWSYGQLRVSLWKWLEWTLWECPYQNEWNRWEMNEMKWIEVNRGKMSDLKDLMRSTLWEWSYGR